MMDTMDPTFSAASSGLLVFGVALLLVSLFALRTYRDLFTVVRRSTSAGDRRGGAVFWWLFGFLTYHSVLCQRH